MPAKSRHPFLHQYFQDSSQVCSDLSVHLATYSVQMAQCALRQWCLASQQASAMTCWYRLNSFICLISHLITLCQCSHYGSRHCISIMAKRVQLNLPIRMPTDVIADLLLLLLEIYAQHDDSATSMYTCVNQQR